MEIRNILSLFDGMSCGQIALNNLNIKYDTYYASEVDKYAMQVTKHNYPNTVHIGSVVNVKSEDLPQIDLLFGGSPCQSFTFAGKRSGMTTKDKIEITNLEQYLSLKSQGFEFEGESYLFWEYVRLLKETKPKYFLLENVKMETKWKDLITSVLGVEPIFINSNVLSPQNRQRLYWTNIPVEEITTYSPLVIKDILDPEGYKFPLTAKHHAGFLRNYKWKHCEIDEKSKPILASYYKQPPHCPYIPCHISESGFRRLSPLECERLQMVPEGYTSVVSNSQRYKMLGNGWTVSVIEHIFSALTK